MSEQTKNILLIGKYIRDELTDDEKLAFEKKVAIDPLLKKELKLQQDIQSAVNDEQLRKFKDSLEIASDSFFKKHKKKVNSLFSFLKMAS